MMIGRFTQDGENYTGNILSLGLQVSVVVISQVPAKQGNGPDFVVLGEIEGRIENDAFGIGAGWLKTSKAGKPYLSVKLDGPTLPAPINCALIKQLDGSFGLIWSRRDQEVAATEAA
jgi:uncharacterized protein (DUF736 family)